MVGLCFYGTAQVDQYGIQSVQGALFTIIAENFFTPMYSAITVFPKRDPLFIRERQAGLYDTFQYYLSTVVALVWSLADFACTIELWELIGLNRCLFLILSRPQIPGLIFEPIIFTAICYFLAGLKPTIYAFGMTSLLSIIIMNISMACGK